MIKSYYRAIDSQGTIHTGFMASSDRAAMDRHLSARGLVAMPLSHWQTIKLGFTKIQYRASWSYSSAALFTLHLAQLLEAGVPLLDSLEELAAMEKNKAIRLQLVGIRERIAHGERLSDALMSAKTLFSREYVAIVQAGEVSGELSHCLYQLHASLQWRHRVSQQLKTALTYPCFAVFTVLAVSLFLLVYLVPAMRPLLSVSLNELPLHTQWLLRLSDLLTNAINNGAISVFLLLPVGGIVFMRSHRLRKMVDAWFLKGFMGAVFAQLALAQFARSSGVLYSAGVEISEAIKLATNTVVNRKLRDELESIRLSVLQGNSLAQAFSQNKHIPSLFTHLINAGERAGVLGNAFSQAAEQMQSNADYALGRLERLLGPVMLCMLGAVLLWVVIALFEPVYTSTVSAGAML